MALFEIEYVFLSKFQQKKVDRCIIFLRYRIQSLHFSIQNYEGRAISAAN